MRRSIMIALIALLAVTLAAPTVLAQGNGVAPGYVDRSFDIPAKDPTAPPTDPASLGCSFPLHVKVTGKEKLIELPDGGFILTAPGQNATVTNVDTDEEVTFNVTGSTFAGAPDENGIVDYEITGRNLASDPAGFSKTLGDSPSPSTRAIQTTSRLLNHRRARGKRSTSANSCPRPAS